MVPKQRKSRTQGRKGRSHHALRPTHTVRCPSCGSPKRPHTACSDCGYVRPGLTIEAAAVEE